MSVFVVKEIYNAMDEWVLQDGKRDEKRIRVGEISKIPIERGRFA